MLHARYLDLELAAGFHAVASTDGRYRSFYTGVEPVAGGRYDLLLVTLDKGDQKQAHLKYEDFPSARRASSGSPRPTPVPTRRPGCATWSRRCAG